ncbi:UNVERIFIED_CONTAM: Protease Do-like 7 [Sesamum latifolium]|uniref:Protease Do-like 7 n=1 Tax=Sesamum latifolium TaxID=2727402 RepID=A0AAW2X978_9LAMI
MSSVSEVDVKSGMEDKLCVEIDQTFKENRATAEDWRRALDKVVPAIVVLRVTACRAFDTESAGVSYATGFVVDKRRGIILTNRHVVKPGPVIAEALFVNREEIPVHPLYRDPVHDFGFFRYDTSSIQFLNYEEIPLAPEAACVGLEIRVVGNDSGEKSALVTVDLHEWYAPPQIYTRNDSSGLWAVNPILALESKLLSPNVNWIVQDLASNRVSSCSADVTPMEQAQQCICQEPMNGVANMKTTCEQVDDGSLSLDKSDAAIKKGQVDKQLSFDVSLLPGFPSRKLSKLRLEASGTETETVLRNNQGAAANASVAERVIEPTLVMFEVHVPSSCMLDGVPSQYFFGTGVIIYHSQTMGLVAVNKNIVFVSVSDVLLSFAAYPIEVPGEVVFLHPVHNFALVAYNPSALGPGASVVRAAELLPEPALCRGDSVCLVGLSSNLQAISRKSFVTNPSAALNMGSAHFQRHRGTNMEVIELDTVLGTTFSGVLTDDLGRVRAIWGSFAIQLKFGGSSELDQRFSRGIPIYTVSQILDKIVSGADGPPLCINGIKRPMPLIRILEVELYPTLLVKARSFGLTDTWIQALVKKDPIRRQVLTVKGCLAGSKAENLLEQGDMVLAINKVPVTCFRDIEEACQELDRCNDSSGKLTLTIFRQGRETDILVGTDVRDGNGSTRMINWCGCIVQDPHPAVRALGFLPEEGHGVYATRWCSGSPTQRYGLYALQWIVEVNGKPTPNLDALVAVTKEIEHGEFVRVRTIHLNGRPRVLTLKQDLHYWPTWELRFDPETAMWRRRTIKALDHSTE